MTELKHIKIESIVPHPQNPRLFMRDDVVDAIAKGITARGEFGQEHAILVRPIADEMFETVAGHHRIEGAKKAGLAVIPAWVREMPEDEAYMELLLTNSQKELANIETGLHALRYAEKSKVGAGAGNKGGISAYAERVGIVKSTLIGYMHAAEVYKNGHMCDYLKNGHTCDNLFESTRYLTEIHSAPKDVWRCLVEYLFAGDKITVALIKNKVKEINALKASIPAWWESVDVPATLESAIKDTHEMKRLMVLFNESVKIFEELKPVEIWVSSVTDEKVVKDGREYYRVEHKKQEYNPGQKLIHRLNRLEAIPKVDDIRDVKKDIQRYIAIHKTKGNDFTPVLTDEEQNAADKERKREEKDAQTELLLSRLYPGDCLNGLRYWGGRIDLLLTDPPYGMMFQSNRRTASGKSDVIHNDDKDSALKLLDEMLKIAVPKMAEDSHAIIFTGDELAGEFKAIIEKHELKFKNFLVWNKANHGSGDLEGSFAPKHELAIHAVKGNPKVSPRIDTVYTQDRKEITTDHPTEKPVSMLEKWILSTTKEGDVVSDPFMGTGATIIAAFNLNRKFWGAEIDAHYFEQAKERLIGENNDR